MKAKHLMALPGPAEFFRAVADDLVGKNCVLVGLPDGFREDAVRACFGRAIRTASSSTRYPLENAPPDSFVSEIVGCHSSTRGVVYIDARSSGAAVARDWNGYVGSEARMVDNVRTRVCVVVTEAEAERCRVEKHFRRQLWSNYVTALDSKVLAMERARPLGASDEHKALKVSLVGALCGSDLLMAERYSEYSLRTLVMSDKHSQRLVWSGQVSVLFPLIDRECIRILRDYHDFWRSRPDGAPLEIKDMQDQWNSHQAGDKSVFWDIYDQIEWLKYARDQLAHMHCIPWERLVVSPVMNFDSAC